jgi:hypothetical protein
MPLRMQMEQLQRQPDVISSLLNLKRTAPQWQLPLYVFILRIPLQRRAHHHHQLLVLRQNRLLR